MLELKALLVHVLPYIPFLSAAVIKSPEGVGGVGVVITRLVEAGIIGAIILYANMQVLEQKFTEVKKDIEACEVGEDRMSKQLEENRIQLRILNLRMEDLLKGHEHNPHSKN